MAGLGYILALNNVCLMHLCVCVCVQPHQASALLFYLRLHLHSSEERGEGVGCEQGMEGYNARERLGERCKSVSIV